jgi:hypothetical protein
MDSRTRWRLHRRGTSNSIGVTLILGMTVAVGVVLWSYRPPLPPSTVSVQYVAIGDQSEPAWGDPTDCTNTTIYATCDVLPAFFLVVTSHSPVSIPLSALTLDLRCNGTSLVNGTLKQLEVVPGTGANPSTGSPALGSCGTWHPSSLGNQATYFNRLLYFQQVLAGSTVLKDGDQIVVYENAGDKFCDRSGHCPDDDYHGAPPWCFTIPNACTLYLTYTANPPSLVATIPIAQLSGN